MDRLGIALGAGLSPADTVECAAGLVIVLYKESPDGTI